MPGNGLMRGVFRNSLSDMGEELAACVRWERFNLFATEEGGARRICGEKDFGSVDEGFRFRVPAAEGQASAGNGGRGELREFVLCAPTGKDEDTEVAKHGREGLLAFRRFQEADARRKGGVGADGGEHFLRFGGVERTRDIEAAFRILERFESENT